MKKAREGIPVINGCSDATGEANRLVVMFDITSVPSRWQITSEEAGLTVSAQLN